MKRRIAVVFTYHNRKEKTLRFLKSLHSQNKCDEYELHFFGCDDGSTDGTSEKISALYPEVTIVHGNGDLYWARGMAAACQKAILIDPDYYLMVNDDVDFCDDMLHQIMKTHDVSQRKEEKEVSIVGATCNSKGQRTYGGSWWEVGKLAIASRMVSPFDDDRKCNIANWNCFLIPRIIFKAVGEIDSYYEHGLADFDYSYRIVKAGYTIYSTDTYIGVCENNPMKGTWKDTSLPFWVRLKLMQKRTAKPWRSDIHFFKKLVGARWPLFVMKQYVAIIIGLDKKTETK